VWVVVISSVVLCAGERGFVLSFGIVGCLCVLFMVFVHLCLLYLFNFMFGWLVVFQLVCFIIFGVIAVGGVVASLVLDLVVVV